MNNNKKKEESINQKNIDLLIGRINLSYYKKSIFVFFLGAGFAKYAFNIPTWKDILKTEHIHEILYLLGIDEEKKNFEDKINNPFKEEISSKNEGLYNLYKKIKGINHNEIYFITTNHCKSIDNYFFIDEYIKFHAVGNKDIICVDSYNEFFIKNEYKIKSEEVKQEIEKKIEINKYEKNIIIIGSSLVEPHIISFIEKNILNEEDESKERKIFYININDNNNNKNESILNKLKSRNFFYINVNLKNKKINNDNVNYIFEIFYKNICKKIITYQEKGCQENKIIEIFSKELNSANNGVISIILKNKKLFFSKENFIHQIKIMIIRNKTGKNYYLYKYLLIEEEENPFILLEYNYVDWDVDEQKFFKFIMKNKKIDGINYLYEEKYFLKFLNFKKIKNDDLFIFLRFFLSTNLINKYYLFQKILDSINWNYNRKINSLNNKKIKEIFNEFKCQEIYILDFIFKFFEIDNKTKESIKRKYLKELINIHKLIINRNLNINVKDEILYDYKYLKMYYNFYIKEDNWDKISLKKINKNKFLPIDNFKLNLIIAFNEKERLNALKILEELKINNKKNLWEIWAKPFIYIKSQQNEINYKKFEEKFNSEFNLSIKKIINEKYSMNNLNTGVDDQIEKYIDNNIDEFLNFIKWDIKEINSFFEKFSNEYQDDYVWKIIKLNMSRNILGKLSIKYKNNIILIDEFLNKFDCFCKLDILYLNYDFLDFNKLFSSGHLEKIYKINNNKLFKYFISRMNFYRFNKNSFFYFLLSIKGEPDFLKYFEKIFSIKKEEQVKLKERIIKNVEYFKDKKYKNLFNQFIDELFINKSTNSNFYKIIKMYYSFDEFKNEKLKFNINEYNEIIEIIIEGSYISKLFSTKNNNDSLMVWDILLRLKYLLILKKEWKFLEKILFHKDNKKNILEEISENYFSEELKIIIELNKIKKIIQFHKEEQEYIFQIYFCSSIKDYWWNNAELKLNIEKIHSELIKKNIKPKLKEIKKFLRNIYDGFFINDIKEEEKYFLKLKSKFINYSRRNIEKILDEFKEFIIDEEHDLIVKEIMKIIYEK